MCYSAQVWADWRRYRKLGGTLDIKGFVRLIDDALSPAAVGQIAQRRAKLAGLQGDSLVTIVCARAS